MSLFVRGDIGCEPTIQAATSPPSPLPTHRWRQPSGQLPRTMAVGILCLA